MRKKIMQMAIIFIIGYGLCAFTILFLLKDNSRTENKGTQLVSLNEIEKLTADENGNSPAKEQIEQLRNLIVEGNVSTDGLTVKKQEVLFFTVGAGYIIIIFIIIYYKILRPFYKLNDYAEKIAGGDLDVALKYERTNFFGEFTWAFDHMREEIIYSKKKEENAINENKTIIATLSHDIKTPIASIRAYSEGLEANLDSDYEKREHYIGVIIKKCDEVTRLVNDLMLHSLSELEKLQIECKSIDIKEVLQEAVHDLEFPHISLLQPVPNANIEADEKRVAQVIENLLNNARKYAPNKDVVIWAQKEDEKYMIHIKDSGNGISPEDMPFIFNRFYRGKNANEQPGSGLGLYIAKYIMEEMNGGIYLNSSNKGLDVVIWFPLN